MDFVRLTCGSSCSGFDNEDNEEKNMTAQHCQQCCVHLCPNEQGHLIKFKEKTWIKFKECVNALLSLDEEKEKQTIAKEFVDLAHANSPLSSVADFGYHSKCYGRFTDISKISRAQIKIGKQKSTTGGQPGEYNLYCL